LGAGGAVVGAAYQSFRHRGLLPERKSARQASSATTT
jgi:hypothetical protein